jgi:hypothetical protein
MFGTQKKPRTRHGQPWADSNRVSGILVSDWIAIRPRHRPHPVEIFDLLHHLVAGVSSTVHVVSPAKLRTFREVAGRFDDGQPHFPLHQEG